MYCLFSILQSYSKKIYFSFYYCVKARSKLPKKRRRVLPVEQPRPKRCDAVCAGVMGAAGLIGNRRMAANTTTGAILKDTFGAQKLGMFQVQNIPWKLNNF